MDETVDNKRHFKNSSFTLAVKGKSLLLNFFSTYQRLFTKKDPAVHLSSGFSL